VLVYRRKYKSWHLTLFRGKAENSLLACMVPCLPLKQPGGKVIHVYLQILSFILFFNENAPKRLFLSAQ